MIRSSLPFRFTLDEPVRFCVEADLLSNGSIGREWLVVTGLHLCVLTSGDTDIRERLKLPLGELRAARAENLVGGGAFEIEHLGRRLEVVRYTNSRAGSFASAAALLSRWLDGEEALIPTEEDTHCPICNFPLSPGSKICPACIPKSRTLRRLLGYLLPYWSAAVGLCLCALFNAGLGLVPAYLNKPLIDGALSGSVDAQTLPSRLTLLALLVLTLVLVHLLRAGIGIGQSWLSSLLGNKITHNIRTQLYQHLQYLSLRFFDKQQMGVVISRVNQDAGQLQQFLIYITQDPIINALQIIGIGTMLFSLNWRLALIVFVPAPIISILARTLWRVVMRNLRHFYRRWGRVNAILSETLNGLRVVKAFAQEQREISRFRSQSLSLAKSFLYLEFLASSVFSTFSLLIMLGTFLVWYVGGRDVLFGHMSLGTLIAFITYTGMFYAPIQSLSHIVDWSSRSLTAAEALFEILDHDVETKETADTVSLPKVEGRVEFRDVSFGYEPHMPILKRISFAVAPGEMIGLVGHSGAGKSTTINLLCHFYHASDGEILIDGIPIANIRLEDLRRQIGLVPQNTFLFSGTIADNIAYARPGAMREEIIRAAKVANAHDFIVRKPDGYETIIGEAGKGLSGGEMQRIAIARAVLHDPRILILDEATSHVDVETEKQIQEAISRLVKGRTTFAIAHRLSTLKNADRLLVLKQGEVAEIGTHDELLAKEDGEFHRLVQTYQEISRVQAVAR